VVAKDRQEARVGVSSHRSHYYCACDRRKKGTMTTSNWPSERNPLVNLHTPPLHPLLNDADSVKSKKHTVINVEGLHLSMIAVTNMISMIGIRRRLPIFFEYLIRNRASNWAYRLGSEPSNVVHSHCIRNNFKLNVILNCPFTIPLKGIRLIYLSIWPSYFNRN
jgi:hypothetical protein